MGISHRKINRIGLKHIIAFGVLLVLCGAIFWVYCIYRDTLYINELESIHIDRKKISVHIQHYNYLTREVDLNIHVGTKEKQTPLDSCSIKIIRNLRIRTCVISGYTVNREHLNEFFNLNISYLSFFLECVSGNAELRPCNRFYQRFEIYTSGLNEQELMILADKCSANDMTISQSNLPKFFDEPLLLSRNAFEKILAANRSKILTLQNFAVYGAKTDSLVVETSNSSHQFDKIVLINCLPVHTIAELLQETSIIDLVFFTSKDFEEAAKELNKHKFKNTVRVVLKGVVSPQELTDTMKTEEYILKPPLSRMAYSTDERRAENDGRDFETGGKMNGEIDENPTKK